MKRTSVSTRKVNLWGSSKDGFTDGVAGVEAPTILDASCANAWQEELAAVVEGSGWTLDGSPSSHQVASLLQVNAEITALCNPSVIGFSGGGETFSDLAANFTGRIVGVCNANGLIKISDDSGLTWSTSTPAASFTGGWNAVIWEPDLGLFIACGDGTIQTSPSGSSGTWTQRVSSGLQYRSVATGNGVVVVTTWDGGTTYSTLTSTNGTTYTVHSQAVALSTQCLEFGGGVFVSPSNNSSTDVFTSVDGVTWATHTWGSGSVVFCEGLGYIASSGHFVAYGNISGGRDLQFSTNGSTWTRARTSTGSASALLVSNVAAYAMADIANALDWVFVGGSAAAPSALDFKSPQVWQGPRARILKWLGRRYVALANDSGFGAAARSALFVGPN